jgi:type II secretory pathway pseudopilin PulG
VYSAGQYQGQRPSRCPFFIVRVDPKAKRLGLRPRGRYEGSGETRAEASSLRSQVIIVSAYRRRRFLDRRGFSILEVLIVCMYISILAAMILPNVTGAGKRASDANLRATLHELRTAVASYQAETGLFPLQLQDLTATEPPATGLTEQGLEVPIFKEDFRGPYLIPSGGELPIDRSTGLRTWGYTTTAPNVGAVHSLSTGTSLDGEPYSLF